MKWGEDTGDFLEELAKLERSHPQSPDYSVQLNYLQTMLSLPWGFIRQIIWIWRMPRRPWIRSLWFGKSKERILEHLAVLKTKGDMKSPIICLYGPPGVNTKLLWENRLLLLWSGNIYSYVFGWCTMKPKFVDIVKPTSVLCRDESSKAR